MDSTQSASSKHSPGGAPLLPDFGRSGYPRDVGYPAVAIVGGGLAGLAAACALAESGFRVTLFERRPFLGGRASSYEHPGTGEVVDNCQHVLFKLCTNLLDFYRRIGIENKIRWFDRMTFIEPGGRQSVLDSTSLPAPLHAAPSFLKFKFLNFHDKVSLARTLNALVTREPRDYGTSFEAWLHDHHQTPAAIERFWKPILVSALSEDLDRISVPYAAQVVRESMKSREARVMGIPMVPLTELYNSARDYILEHGGEVRLRSNVQGISSSGHRIALQPPDSAEHFEYCVLSVPADSLAKILPDSPEFHELGDKISHFENSPITGVHLWFDRQITDLPHAVLLDRTIQWMFHKSMLLAKGNGEDVGGGPMSNHQEANQWETRNASSESDPAPKGRRNLAQGVSPGYGEEMSESRRDDTQNRSYLELVISSSKSLINKSRQEIIDLALKEVREFFPTARDANLVKAIVIKEVNATFSPAPGIDQYRPAQSTAWPRLFLAGDWTATGWPATMEGAVRSGYLAAEAITKAAGDPKHFLVPDLPARGLMRLFW